MDDKKIGIASDHAGYQLKEFIIGYLDSKGYDVHDFGCHSERAATTPTTRTRWPRRSKRESFRAASRCAAAPTVSRSR